MTGNRHEAEDIVQDTFRSAWASRARYESGRGDRAWLASMLRRRVIDRWRKKSTWHELPMEESLEPAVETISAQNVEMGDEMQAALNRLPQELRETLLLVVVGELTHQEVADLLDIPLGTALSRVSRARTRLRDILVAMQT